MKFSVGYQLPDERGSFVEVVRDHRDRVAEVYFPWVFEPSGRAVLNRRRGWADWRAQSELETDLRDLRRLGVRLDLLFNANCYGGRAVSKQLEQHVASIVEHVAEVADGLDAVTTTSPAVAHVVKRHFPRVEVRASVNLRIGEVAGLELAADLFDSFHVQRDYNRDLGRLAELGEWARRRGKTLHLLANSGCMRFCSGQTFHDNCVAHEAELDEQERIEGFHPHFCWRYLADRGHWPTILANTWVRPEDLHHYEAMFPVVKLATRMHAQPGLVVGAYAAGRFHGNLLDLFEPAFSRAVAPYIIDNDRFPADWFERSCELARTGGGEEYFTAVLDQVLVRPPE